MIVGGGPAGVHMSACLAAKGSKNVTLLEAEAEVGGKSLTMYDPSQPDVPHELGTCYMSPGYTLIRNLLDEYDKDLQRMQLEMTLEMMLYNAVHDLEWVEKIGPSVNG